MSDPNSERLRQATVALRQMRRKLDELEARNSEPIAIIGQGCRFPGGANSPGEYWQMLRDGRHAVGRIPADRWDADAYFDPDPDAYWKMYSRSGNFIDQPIDAFEPEFFGISPREALSLDPQQRLILEVVWESLEDAGIAADTLVGSATGVFVGMITGDYGRVPFTDVVPGDLPYFGTGNAISFPAGRVSYVLGLQGPCMVVATACSATLVSTHLACRALRARECDLALSGGASLMIHPDTSLILSQMRATAPDGRSKTFDAGADGFGRGEGCGFLVLKRLSDAQRDGDRVLALVRGSAVNHDGASGGITVPSGPAQEKVLASALRSAGLEPGDIDYIEAHGTGTPLGDPIEVLAIGRVYGRDRNPSQPLKLGSGKTNIGHLEAAAGVAGLIKLTQSLVHEELPAHLHLREPNPNVPWDELPIEIVTERTPWLRCERPRRATISAFGLSGINANVVVEEAPPSAEPPPELPGPAMLPLSARTEAGLEALVDRYVERFEASSWAERLDSICDTATRGRSRLRHRLAVVASTREELAAKLRARDGARGCVREGAPTIAFLFTGQGAQHPSMGRELIATQPVFRDALARCDAALEFSLFELFESADEDTIDRTEYAQPALCAFELALAALWRSWGLTPDLVLGHSVGEYAAAVIAGVLEPEAAMRLLSARGRLMQSLPAGGEMITIEAPEAAVRRALADDLDSGIKWDIAAINGPANTVVSGAGEQVRALAERFVARGVKVRPLRVHHAFHSSLMDPVLTPFEQALERETLRPPSLPFVSSMTGRLESEAFAYPGYWSQQIRREVRWLAGLQAAHAWGSQVYLEIGPRPTLVGLAAAALDSGPAMLASVGTRLPDNTQLLHTAARLFALGAPVSVCSPGPRPPRAVLPTYPFQRRSFWVPLKHADAPKAAPSHYAAVGRALHPLLGQRVRVANGPRVFESHLDTGRLAYLEDHRVYDTVLLPATGFLELVLAGLGVELGAERGFALSEVELRAPLELSQAHATTVQLHLVNEPGGMSWTIHSLQSEEPPETWTLHAAGTGRILEPGARATVDLAALRARCQRSVSITEFYDSVATRGITYGPSFRGLESLLAGDGEALGRIELPTTLDHADYHVHPVLLDSCLQCLGAVLPASDDSTVYLPVGLDALDVHARPGRSHWVHARLPATTEQGQAILRADFTVLDDAGQLVVEVRGLRFQRAPRSAMLPDRARPWRRWLFHTRWVEAPEPEPRPPNSPRSWLVLARPGALAEQLAASLRERGDEVLLAYPGAELSARADGSHRLDPSEATHMVSILRAVSAQAAHPLGGVVHLWSLGPEPEQLAELEAAWRLGCGSALLLAKALATGAVASPPPLWLVTQAATEAADVPNGWTQGPTWGLAKVIAREHPELASRVVDLLDADPILAARALARELSTAAPGEPMVARSIEQRRVPRLGRFAGEAREAELRRDASYLVVGGLGGVGLQTARWLARRGAGRLVLASRSASNDARLDELRASGTLVEVVAGDVALPEDCARIIAQANSEMHPLRGIFHSGGVLDDSILLRQDLDRFAKVFAPKVAGSWNLHRHSLELELDHFVLYGSAAVLLGNPGQANYVAANAFVDALAHMRHRRGRPGLSIAWGAWAVGMSEREGAQDRIHRSKVETMPADEACAALGHLLAQHRSQVAVLPFDPASLGDAAEHPLVSELLASAGVSTSASGAFAERLAATPVEERGTHLRDHVRQRVSAILGFGGSTSIDSDAGFFDVGMDSLMSVELRNLLQTDLGCALPNMVAFDHPTIDQLAAFLLEVFNAAHGVSPSLPASGEDSPTAAAGDDLAEVLDAIDQLSNDDVQLRFSAALASEVERDV